MFRTLIFLGVLASWFAMATPSVKEVDLFDKSRERPVKVRIWYDNSRQCQNANCLDSAPLMVFSHGAFGSPREYNWLAFAMAARGWNVIAPAHYGESWVYGRETVDPASVSRIDLRVQDLKFVLNNLDNIPNFANLSQAKKIVVAGHSSGGFTALSLAGATFNHEKMASYCSDNVETDKSCQYDKKPKPTVSHADENDINKPELSEKVANGIIVFDPALGPGVNKASLTEIDIPILIFGSENNDFLSFRTNAKYFADSLPYAELVTLANGEGHFVYLDACNHSHKAMGVSLCKDREGVNRESAHQNMIKSVHQFINNISEH